MSAFSFVMHTTFKSSLLFAIVGLERIRVLCCVSEPALPSNDVGSCCAGQCRDGKTSIMSFFPTNALKGFLWLTRPSPRRARNYHHPSGRTLSGGSRLSGSFKLRPDSRHRRSFTNRSRSHPSLLLIPWVLIEQSHVVQLKLLDEISLIRSTA